MVAQFRSVDLIVYGHTFHVPCMANGRRAASFTFKDLCERNYGPADYIALSKIFHVVAISHIPRLTLNNRNEIRRFITLIDALYEGKVLVLIMADTAVHEIFTVNAETRQNSVFDEVFAFDRTVSRLLEMQSTEYVKTAMISHRQGTRFLRRTLTELPLQGYRVPRNLDVGERRIALDTVEPPKTPTKNKHEATWRWVMRNLWYHYRIGTVDEVQHYLRSKIMSSRSSSSISSFGLRDNDNVTSSEDTLGNAEGSALGIESKQVIATETFRAMLEDIADFFLQDFEDNDPRAIKIGEYLTKVESNQDIRAGAYIDFATFSAMTEEFVTSLVSQREVEAK